MQTYQDYDLVCVCVCFKHNGLHPIFGYSILAHIDIQKYVLWSEHLSSTFLNVEVYNESLLFKLLHNVLSTSSWYLAEPPLMNI